MADRHGLMNRSLAFALCMTAGLAASVSAQQTTGPRAGARPLGQPLGTAVNLIGSPVIPTGDSVGADKVLVAAALGSESSAASFTLAQLQYDRVRDARAEVRYGIKKLFRDRGLRYPAADIYMRVFKRERALELWVRPEGDTIFSLLRTYDICALSGELGPKRGKGDNQVPEGFYNIDHFNPYSDYHLSLHVDYPNRSDQLLSTKPDLGGDIMVHGGCNSIGCLALTDEGIKQLYWITVEARAAGQQRIPIDIYPARLDDENITQLARVFAKSPALVNFWRTLKPGYDFFEENHRLPNVRVDAIGHYIVNNASVPGTPTTAIAGGRPLGTPVKAAVTPASAPLGTPLGTPLGASAEAPLGAPVQTAADSTAAKAAPVTTPKTAPKTVKTTPKTAKKPAPGPLGTPVTGGGGA